MDAHVCNGNAVSGAGRAGTLRQQLDAALLPGGGEPLHLPLPKGRRHRLRDVEDVGEALVPGVACRMVRLGSETGD